MALFAEVVTESSAVLMEGSVIERLRRDPDISLDPFILNAGLIYGEPGRSALAAIYGQYMKIGAEFGLPILCLTPTWRAGRERLGKAGYGESTDVNGDCARFLRRIREEFGDFAERIFIGGLMGVRGDAYDPGEALSREAAANHHAFQARALAAAGVDFLIASTLPALSEALGMAAAMAQTGIPYVISFIIGPSGSLLDGTPLPEAVERVDAAAAPPPFAVMINCVHPLVFEQAIESLGAVTDKVLRRVIGLQANTSPLSPEELDGLDHLEAEDPAVLARLMIRLHNRFGLSLLGGCCGTDHRHIAEIAERLAEIRQP
jgi:homocysteine S-methyltransferase